MQDTSTLAASHLARVIREGIEEESVRGASNPMWARMRELGTELWLDTGDLDEATRLWSAEFTALTTNNTLLNKEIQKGIYDKWIPRAAEAARQDQPNLDEQELVLEIAFALTARHGLRLVERFGAYVSVELHTDLAHDVDRSVYYGRRYHAICPDRFIVKVPLTPSGLIAARRLEDQGIPVNFTLGFSARQNFLIATVARPSWVNVFMGRLNAYTADNSLCDGQWVGERATLASQRAVKTVRGRLGTSTRQIGASMRSGDQVATLAGLDVYTMPTKVSEQFLESYADPAALLRRTHEDYQPKWASSVNTRAEGVEDLWQVTTQFESACRGLEDIDPEIARPDELVRSLHESGQGSVFPELSDEQHASIATDGKLPKHDRWADALAQGFVGLDALFTLAGLYSFSKDQAALDERIRRHL